MPNVDTDKSNLFYKWHFIPLLCNVLPYSVYILGIFKLVKNTVKIYRFL